MRHPSVGTSSIHTEGGSGVYIPQLHHLTGPMMAQCLYGSLGFEPVGRYEEWVGSASGDDEPSTRSAEPGESGLTGAS